MGYDFWAGVAEEEAKARAERAKFYHEKFRKDFLYAVYHKQKRFRDEVYEDHGEEGLKLPVSYENAEITCCPEPLEFISVFNDYIGNLNKCQRIMRELITGTRQVGKAEFKRIRLERAPEDGSWFNSTKDKVNLRPGTLEAEDGRIYRPVQLGDLSVHGVVVGRTGSGKSVFLNNLILNLLTEYAPWELDLYLADFKKVELSRYMSAGEAYHTPHLKTCAATSEIRYVITMLKHLVKCMQARQDLFTRLGIQKLSEFREKYHVVLPRVILLIDEFQQMFQEATSGETLVINELLMSIIKLGRATGFHLILASQEMRGALSSKALANFKIKFALPCDSGVSSEILGNPAASALERGYVLVNAEAGDEEDNLKYRVPYIKDDEEDIEQSYFYQSLNAQVKQEQTYGFRKRKTFYQEDEQQDVSELKTILRKIRPAKKEELRSKPNYYDIITLGNGVVYSEKKYDLETFYIERGRNKNIFVACPDVDDLAYVQKLLALNFARSFSIDHYYFDFHQFLSAKYNIAGDLTLKGRFDSLEQLASIRSEYFLRMSVMEAAGEPDILAFMKKFADKMKALTGEKMDNLVEAAKEIFADVSGEQILDRCQELEDEGLPNIRVLTVPAKYYYVARYEYQDVVDVPWDKIFPARNYWISGVEYIDNMSTIKKWFWPALRNGMTVNIFFLMFCSSDEVKFSDFVSVSDYLFVSGNVEKIYKRCGMTFTKKGRSSIVVDFKIKSLNTERSFKKYKIRDSQYEAPALDFDLLLS